MVDGAALAPELGSALAPELGSAMESELAGRLMEEVARDVRKRRAAGSVPEALESEVDAALERFAPRGSAGSRVSDLLAVAERASVVDVTVPLRGRRPGEAAARRLVRMSMAWYIEHVAQQSRRFASAEVGLLRALDQRVSALEARAGLGLGQRGPVGWSSLSRRPPTGAYRRTGVVPAATLASWRPLVLELMGGVKGRVLHAECGDGWLLSELVAVGLDAYGVDPYGLDGLDAAARVPGAGELDIWPDDVSGHLRSVSGGGLGGLVLTGCVEFVSPDMARRIAGLAVAKLAPDGRLLLIAGNPPGLGHLAPSPIAELADGRALHPQTWQHLLASAGFASTETHIGADSFAVSGRGPVARA